MQYSAGHHLLTGAEVQGSTASLDTTATSPWTGNHAHGVHGGMVTRNGGDGLRDDLKRGYSSVDTPALLMPTWNEWQNWTTPYSSGSLTDTSATAAQNTGSSFETGTWTPPAPVAPPPLNPSAQVANAKFFNACFAAGTPILTPNGSQPIETLQVGDRVWSRPENDDNAPVRIQVVEQTFERFAAIVCVHVNGRMIETTALHRFFVIGSGWTPAAELNAGDRIVSHHGTLHHISAVEPRSNVVPVFNVRVSQDHTYFVGDPSWRFSVWVHNEYDLEDIEEDFDDDFEEDDFTNDDVKVWLNALDPNVAAWWDAVSGTVVFVESHWYNARFSKTDDKVNGVSLIVERGNATAKDAADEIISSARTFLGTYYNSFNSMHISTEASIAALQARSKQIADLFSIVSRGGDDVTSFGTGLIHGFFVDGIWGNVEMLGQLGSFAWRNSPLGWIANDVQAFIENKPEKLAINQYADMATKIGSGVSEALPTLGAVAFDIIKFANSPKDLFNVVFGTSAERTKVLSQFSPDTQEFLQDTAHKIGVILAFVKDKVHTTTEIEWWNIAGRLSGMILYEVAEGVLTAGVAKSAAFLKITTYLKKLLKLDAAGVDELAKLCARCSDEMVDAASGLRKYCFAAGTPVLTPTGDQPIESLRPGDRVLSRPEEFPDAPVRIRIVERLFALRTQTWELRLGGNTITTTAEHPFYVVGRGWVTTEHLFPGDEILGHDGHSTCVESIDRTNRIEPVYNLRVSEDHTYFVGAVTWGFSAWVHNQYKAQKVTDNTWGIWDDVTNSWVKGRMENGSSVKGGEDTFSTTSEAYAKKLAETWTKNAPAPNSNTPYALFNKTHAGSQPVPKGLGPNGGRLQSHHGLQQEWAANNLPGYDPKLAPTVTIETGRGFPHTTLSNLQNARRDARAAAGLGKWSSSIDDELGFIVSDFRQAGFGDDVVRQVLEQNYRMLDKLGIRYTKPAGF